LGSQIEVQSKLQSGTGSSSFLVIVFMPLVEEPLCFSVVWTFIICTDAF